MIALNLYFSVLLIVGSTNDETVLQLPVILKPYEVL